VEAAARFYGYRGIPDGRVRWRGWSIPVRRRWPGGLYLVAGDGAGTNSAGCS